MAAKYFHHRTLYLDLSTAVLYILKMLFTQTSPQFGMKKGLHQSVTDWDSTDGGLGLPDARCCPVGCKLLPRLTVWDARVWPAVLDFFTSKPPFFCDQHQTELKLGDTVQLNDLSQQAPQELLTPHSSPFALCPFAYTVPLFTHLDGRIDSKTLWMWQGKCAVPLICPSVWNAFLCSKCKLST